MSATLAPLTVDLLAWLADGPRDYADVMDAWRTSCPRLTVWEDAVDSGLVACVHGRDRKLQVRVTEAGIELLRARGQ